MLAPGRGPQRLLSMCTLRTPRTITPQVNWLRTASLLFALATAFMALAQTQAPDAFEQNRKLGRGVNIIGYDPLWRNRDQARFKEQYFKFLKEAGFNSVRINLHAFRHMDASKEWALRDAWWDTLNWAVEKATAQGLAVILDLHEFGAMGENPEDN